MATVKIQVYYFYLNTWNEENALPTTMRVVTVPYATRLPQLRAKLQTEFGYSNKKYYLYGYFRNFNDEPIILDKYPNRVSIIKTPSDNNYN